MTQITIRVNSVSFYQDERGWWVLSSLFEDGPEMRFLFWETAWLAFKWRVKHPGKTLEEIADVRSAGSSSTVQ